MTVIIGLETKRGVMMGGDSASTAGYISIKSRIPKVFKLGNFVLGGSGSWRMISLLQYSLKIPTQLIDQTDTEYMNITFINAVRDCFADGGYKTVSNEVETIDSHFLVGYKKKLYLIDPDFQLNSSSDGYMSIGSGAEVALGSLFSNRHLNPKNRINKALEATTYFNAGVCKPFLIVKNY